MLGFELQRCWIINYKGNTEDFCGFEVEECISALQMVLGFS